MPHKFHQHPAHPSTFGSCLQAAAAALATILAWQIAPAQADDYPKVYEVIRNIKGERTGTIECDGITSQCITRDTRGRRTGTIERDQGSDLRGGITAAEIIEQERRDEGIK
jgi:hypothetical protein